MADEDKTKNLLDCSGLCCSLPLVEARMQLDKMKVGETLEVIATYSSAEKDIEILTSLKPFDLIRTWKEADLFHFLIKKVQ
jgi:TusA-related sulfurtransferase